MSDLRTLAQNIEAIGRSTEVVKKIGAAASRPNSDISNLLTQVNEEEERAKALIQATSIPLRERCKEYKDAETKRHLEKLMRDFKVVYTQHEQTLKSVVQKLREELQRKREDQVHQRQTEGTHQNRYGNSTELSEPLMQQQMQHQEIEIQFLDIELQAEKLNDLNKLQSDLQALGELFQDVAVMTEAQQTKLDNIESEVVNATDKVQTGISELDKAKTHQKSARKKMCCILCCVVILLAVAVSIFGGVTHGFSGL